MYHYRGKAADTYSELFMRGVQCSTEFVPSIT